MTLQKAPIMTVPIVGGLEEGTDGNLATKLKTLRNGYYEKRGGVSKRWGNVRALAANTQELVPGGTSSDQLTASAMGDPDVLFTHGDELVTCSRHRCHGLTTGTDWAGTKWVYKGRVSPCTATVQTVSPTVSDATSLAAGRLIGNIDCATNSSGTVMCVLAMQGVDLVATLLDTATGALLKKDVLAQVATTNIIGRVCSVGDTFVVGYQQWDGSSTINFKTLNSANAGATWQVYGATIVDARFYNAGPPAEFPTWDMCGTSAAFYVAHGTTAAPQIVVRRYTLALGASYTTIATTSSVGADCAISCDGTTVWVAWNDSTDNKGYVWAGNATTLAASLAKTQVSSWSAGYNPTSLGILATSSSSAVVVWGAPVVSGGFDAIMMRWHVVLNLAGTLGYGGAVGNAPISYWASPLTKPFYDPNGRVCVVAHFRHAPAAATSSQVLPGGAYLLDLHTTESTLDNTMRPRVMAHWRPRQLAHFGRTAVDNYGVVSSASAAVSILSQVTYSAGSRAMITALPGPSIVTASNTYACASVDTVRFDFNVKRTSAQIGTSQLISGGVPTSYDGQRTCEASFLSFPDADRIPSIVTAGGGSMTASSNYVYKIVYARTDSAGNVARSAPSKSIPKATGAGHTQCTITIPTLGLTQFDEHSSGAATMVEVYRTVAGGATFYLVATVPTLNVTTNGYVTVVDRMADTELQVQRQLYTTGGVLDNVSPPSAAIVCANKRRFWLAGTDDDRIWYSKEILPGEAPAFNEGLTLDPFEGGRVTALGTLDDKLIIFKEDSIWLVVGEGATDLGTGATLSLPTQISADCGCIEPRSVVTTSLGVMFLSRRGIMLLTRGLDVQFVGEGVSDLDTSLYTIESAVLVPHKQQVRFSSRRNSGGDVLVFDLLHQAWARWGYYDADAGATRAAPWLTVKGGTAYWLTLSGALYSESSSSWLDNTTQWVPLTIETSDIKLSNALRGYARLWRVYTLGYKYERHDFTIELVPNYGESGVDSYPLRSYANASFDALATFKPETVPTLQNVEAIRIKYSDATPAGVGADNGRASRISGFALEYGVHNTGYRGGAATVKG